MNRRVRLLAAEHKAGQLRAVADSLSDELIDAGAGADSAAGGEGGAGEKIAGLRAMDVSLQRFGVIQPADEDHLAAELFERSEHLAELHRRARTFGPPFVAMVAAA
jgi:hypothetical protein